MKNKKVKLLALLLTAVVVCTACGQQDNSTGESKESDKAADAEQSQEVESESAGDKEAVELEMVCNYGVTLPDKEDKHGTTPLNTQRAPADGHGVHLAAGLGGGQNAGAHSLNDLSCVIPYVYFPLHSDTSQRFSFIIPQSRGKSNTYPVDKLPGRTYNHVILCMKGR